MRTLRHWWAGHTPVCAECQRRVLLEDTDVPHRFAENYPDTQEGSIITLYTAEFPCPCGNVVTVQRMEHEFEATFPRLEA